MLHRRYSQYLARIDQLRIFEHGLVSLEDDRILHHIPIILLGDRGKRISLADRVEPGLQLRGGYSNSVVHDFNSFDVADSQRDLL